MEEKILDWIEAGTRLVLVLNPEKRTVTAFRSRVDVRVLGSGEVVEGDDVVPGWRLPGDRIFA